MKTKVTLSLGRSGKKWARFGPGSVPSGWKKAASQRTRHAAIRKDVAKEGGQCTRTFRKLLQVANVTTDRPTEKKARADYRWLKKQGWCRMKTKKTK